MRTSTWLALAIVCLCLPLAAQQNNTLIRQKADQIKTLADEIKELAQDVPVPPVVPVDCVVSQFTQASAGPWEPAVCPSTGEQTRSEIWTRTVLTPPANGGVACPALVETRVGLQTCTPAPQPPAGSVLWRMDCRNGAYPQCGATGLWETAGAPFTKALQPQTPKGTGAIEYTATPTATHSQPYMGFSKTITPYGAVSRFLRFSLRIGAGFIGRGVAPESVYTDKFIILGQGSSDRMICVLAPRQGLSDLWIRCAKGIGAYPQGTPDVQLTIGQFERIQVEVRGGTAGYIKLWLNQGNYATPTAVSGAVSLASTTWTVLGVGFYHNGVIASGGSLKLAVGDVEWAETFDPNW